MLNRTYAFMQPWNIRLFHIFFKSCVLHSEISQFSDFSNFSDTKIDDYAIRKPHHAQIVYSERQVLMQDGFHTGLTSELQSGLQVIFGFCKLVVGRKKVFRIFFVLSSLFAQTAFSTHDLICENAWKYSKIILCEIQH